MTEYMQFAEKWQAAVQRKNSILCFGLDPTEPAQRPGEKSVFDGDKFEACLRLVEQVAPHAAAVKINRNYIKDFSRAETRRLLDASHRLGLVTIDDSKVADIGSTNDSAFFHAAQEGFDAVTYAPFPGNMAEAADSARNHGVGLIALVLMSNPEFEVIKNSTIQGMKGYEFFATQVRDFDVDAMVIGAPSGKNHLRREEIERAAEIAANRLVLMPGLGAQGGEAQTMIEIFGDRVIANVGRAILFAEDPSAEAKKYCDVLNNFRAIRKSN